MTKKHLLLILILYVISALASYGVCAAVLPGSNSATNQPTAQTGEEEETLLAKLLQIDPSEPKDQVCPLNGAYFTKTEQQAWAKRRPLFVMIENTPDARPQSGMSRADVVFEAVAEGGVTRFGAMFYCAAQVEDLTLAPIRSARTYFIDWASGFNRPMYVHVGGANMAGPADALGQLGDYGWNLENDINQFSVGYPTFVRNENRLPGKEVATEHTMETSTELLWAVAAKRDWTNMTPETKVGKKVIPAADWTAGYEGWAFEDSKPAAGDVVDISYDFWSGYSDYSVKWHYDAASDTYARSQGGESHIDLNNNEPVKAANVIVLLTTEKGPIDDKKHMLYGTTGTGKALVFNHGQVTKANWAKKTRESELSFTDAAGKDLKFARGTFWISAVSTDTEVTY